MIIFPTPPAADPLHIFRPDGPINPAFMRNLIETTLATQPLPAGASPERRAEHRLATMHAIAAFQPGDALEAMLAGQIVAANARMMRCFALAAEPDADKAGARRDGAQAASLIRCTQAMRRDFQRQQAIRRKEEDKPSERAGYWFRDVSVPAPEGVPARGATGILPEDPIHHEEPAGTSRHDPMQSGNARPAAVPPRTNNVPPRSTSGASDVAAARRINPVSSEENDLPDRMTTGDAMMRFASRRLDPNESVEAAWAQATAEAAAEEAEAARP